MHTSCRPAPIAAGGQVILRWEHHDPLKHAGTNRAESGQCGTSPDSSDGQVSPGLRRSNRAPGGLPGQVVAAVRCLRPAPCGRGDSNSSSGRLPPRNRTTAGTVLPTPPSRPPTRGICRLPAVSDRTHKRPARRASSCRSDIRSTSAGRDCGPRASTPDGRRTRRLFPGARDGTGARSLRGAAGNRSARRDDVPGHLEGPGARSSPHQGSERRPLP